jgi:hypothetical protein
MRYIVLLFSIFCLATTTQAQSFIVEDTRPKHGSASVSLSSEIAFAFSEEISVGTDWNTAFVSRPSDSLSYNQVSLCLNFEGSCGGGEDVPRFVRFQVDHEPDTDYTWMVYAVETADGNALDEPFVLRYTTASSIGQQSVSGAVHAPTAKATWSPPVRTSLRTLARGLKRSGLGQPIFDSTNPNDPKFPSSVASDASKASDAAPSSHVGAIGAKSHNGGHTQILLLSNFSDAEAEWAVRGADVITADSGTYTAEHLRKETYWPVAVRYADGTNTKIEAFGFHDPNGDGTPDPVRTAAGSLTGIDIQLYEFPLTTARSNLGAAVDAAPEVAPDQELRMVEAGSGMRPAGTAYAWTYRFYSSSTGQETRVTVTPLDVQVETNAADFVAEMKTIPKDFIDSHEATQIALDNGGQELIDPLWPSNITTVLRGGNLYWTDAPVPTEEFWHVRLITATSTQVHAFDRYIDIATGAILDVSDHPDAPAPPNGFTSAAGDGEVTLSWTAQDESGLSGYRLYRTGEAPATGADIVSAGNRVATIPAGAQSYQDTDLTNGKAYYYQLTTVDADVLESAPSLVVAALPYPSSLAVSVSHSFGDATDEQDYRLVALPGAVERDIGRTISGEPGTDWQAVWDNGASQDYFREYDGSDTFRFTPGRGFWMMSDNTWSVDETFETVDLIADTAATIDLHDGWNIISNPLDKDVPWSAVEAANSGALQTLWSFDGSFNETPTFTSAKSGEAFYFLNDQELGQLTIPYPGAPKKNRAERIAEKSTPTVKAPTLTLSTYQDGARTSAVKVGTAPDAEEGIDVCDQFAPPGHFESTSFRLLAPESAASKRLQYLAHEFRPADGPGQTFQLALRGTSGEPVTIKASGLAAFGGQEVVLVDQATARPYDLHQTASVTLRPDGETLRLSLAVGTSAYVELEKARATPDGLELHPNYPNPFATRTTIEYALPEQGQVRFEIYDILGRRIQTLIDEKQRPGFHRVRWDGRNRLGRSVASGVYFGRLTAEGKHELQKMVIVR